ncbi:MAG: hypothetical protein ACI35W_04625 [Anaeroplasmataceae bacterium]
MNFIKNNLRTILIIVAIAVYALFLPLIINLIDSGLNKYSIIYLSYYGCLIISATVLLILANKNGQDRNMINAGVVIIILSSVLLNGYNAIEYSSAQNFAYIAIYLVVAVYFVILLATNKSKEMLLIPLGVLIVLEMPGTFSGSSVALAKLLMLISFTICNQFLNDYSANEYYN